MRYEFTTTTGVHSQTSNYEGTPQEINELMKLQKSQEEQVIFPSKLNLTINGDVAAEKIKKEIDNTLRQINSSVRGV